jgi:hypothetical protein
LYYRYLLNQMEPNWTYLDSCLYDFWSIWKFNMAARVNYNSWLAKISSVVVAFFDLRSKQKNKKQKIVKDNLMIILEQSRV